MTRNGQPTIRQRKFGTIQAKAFHRGVTLSSTPLELFSKAREDPTLVTAIEMTSTRHWYETQTTYSYPFKTLKSMRRRARYACMYSSLHQARHYISVRHDTNSNPQGVYGRVNFSKAHHHVHLYLHGLVRTRVLFHQARQMLTPFLLKLPSVASHTVIYHPRSSLGQRLPLVRWRCYSLAHDKA